MGQAASCKKRVANSSQDHTMVLSGSDGRQISIYGSVIACFIDRDIDYEQITHFRNNNRVTGNMIIIDRNATIKEIEFDQDNKPKNVIERNSTNVPQRRPSAKEPIPSARRSSAKDVPADRQLSGKGSQRRPSAKDVAAATTLPKPQAQDTQLSQSKMEGKRPDADDEYEAPADFTQPDYTYPRVVNNNVYKGQLPPECQNKEALPKVREYIKSTYNHFGAFDFDSKRRDDSLPIIGPVFFEKKCADSRFDRFFYRGQVNNGKPHGLGVAVMQNGGRYEGEWRDGLPHGHGRLITFAGDMFVGEWLNGRLNGMGKYYDYYFKLVYEGRWLNDKMQTKQK